MPLTALNMSTLEQAINCTQNRTPQLIGYLKSDNNSFNNSIRIIIRIIIITFLRTKHYKAITRKGNLTYTKTERSLFD